MPSIATTAIPGDLRAKLASIAAAGFRKVELFEPDFTTFNGTAGDVRQQVDELGLELIAMQPFVDLEGLIGAEREAAFGRLEYKFDLMHQLGIDLLLIGASSHPEARGEHECLIEDLGELALRAKARNLRAGYMALPWARHVQSDEAARQLIGEIASPHLGLAINSAFALIDGSKPARLRDVSGDSLFHVQLSDALKPRDPASPALGAVSLLPGQGELNLAGFVRVLAKCGYRGAWSCAQFGETAASGASAMAGDGYRALVNLLDEAARNEPDINFDVPGLPERVHATGFEFIEFAVDDESAAELTQYLRQMCFRQERRHISKSVEHWRQGSVNIVINTDKNGFARETFKAHGPTVCDMGIRVKDADRTVARATALGAPHFSQPVGAGELDIPAIRGVGGNVVHFIDEKSNLHRVWDIEFEPVKLAQTVQPAGLRRIDHIAQTMRYDEMQSWLLYYISTFEMSKTSMLDVTDPSGVVRSQAIASPEGEVRLNLNGAQSQRTFAGAFLGDRIEAGVQHLAFLTDDIFETSGLLRQAGFQRLAIPANYYADLKATFGLSDEKIERLRSNDILYDREGSKEYFQIYGQPIFQGFFFEIVERRAGYDGYGARNAPIRIAAQMQNRRENTKED